jgi:hypothetical protein
MFNINKLQAIKNKTMQSAKDLLEFTGDFEKPTEIENPFIPEEHMKKILSFRPNEEKVNHPKHYNQYPVEVIDMMVAIWGKEKVAYFCLMNAFKYRMRLCHKDDMKQDFEKEQWYLKKFQELNGENKGEMDD